MDIIYNDQVTNAAIPATRALAAGETDVLTVGYAVDGWCLIGSTGAVKVQASNDNFSTLAYDSGTVSASESPMRRTVEINAAQWRVQAVGTATVGLLYVGRYAKTRSPAFPFSFEQAKQGTDRRTMGGALYSVIRYTARRGTWSISGIDSNEAALWRSIYSATDGFRKPMAVKVDGLVYLITAPSEILLLDRAAPDLYTLQLPAEEVV